MMGLPRGEAAPTATTNDSSYKLINIVPSTPGETGAAALRRSATVARAGVGPRTCRERRFGVCQVFAPHDARPAGARGIDAADATMVLVIAIWAGNNAIVKWAIDDIDPVAYALSRFALVVALIFPWLWPRRADLRVRRPDWLPLFVSGLTGFSVYNLLFTVGLAHTSAFSVGLLVSLGPVFTLLLAAALGIERVRPGQWLGVGVALTGVAVFVGEKLASDVPAWGDLLGVLAAVCFAIYGLLARRLSGRYPVPVVTCWSALIGLLTALPVAIWPALTQDWVGIGWRGWGAMLYSAALSMLLAY